jgi:lipopolysaccharide/colanic/teichoic acid biosynthesis glycosyltransferase
MSSLPQLHQISTHNRKEIAFDAVCEAEAKSGTRRSTSHARSAFYTRFGKPVFDIVVAAAALVVAGPVLLLCAVAVRLESRGPVFFRQWRVGQNGKPFQVIKLRTMIHGADKQGPKITASGDRRITRVGGFLRRTKLDELPQLLNVLRNEMSLVGPRPEVPEYTLKYSLAERKVLDVKPGITGPASLAYINEEQLLASRTDKEHFYVTTIMRRKLQLDLAYRRKMSFFEDLKNILQTAGALFASEDFRSKSMKSRASCDQVDGAPR